MPVENVSDLMAASATEILETMFFVAPEEMPPPPAWNATRSGASVEFHGARAGRFEIYVEEDLGREMAAGFLGAVEPGEVEPEQLSQVTCELANMVCGVTLSRMAPDAIFCLNAPQTCPAPLEADTTETVRWLDSGSGLIRLALSFAPPKSQANARVQN